MNENSAAERSWRNQIIRFGLVGAVGFLVDAGALYAYLRLEPGHFYSGRAVSYVAAASVNWLLNANFTFGRVGGFGQWGRFLLFNLGGGAVNYGLYAALIATVPLAAQRPVLAVAAGAIAGFGVNFLVSRKFVFAGA